MEIHPKDRLLLPISTALGLHEASHVSRSLPAVDALPSLTTAKLARHQAEAVEAPLDATANALAVLLLMLAALFA